MEPLLQELKTESTVEWLIEQIWQRSGVLVEQSLGRYGFAHRAFQDYLVAKYILDRGNEALLLSNIGSERWKEIILVSIAEAKEQQARAIVRALLNRNESDDARELEIAGAALSEDVQLGADLRAEVKKRLVSRLSRTELSGAFSRLAAVLIDSDVNAAREWMEQILRTSDPVSRRRVLELIPSLGEKNARSLSELIFQIAGNSNEDPRVRVQAVTAVGEAFLQPDADFWLVLARIRSEGDFRLRAAATRTWCFLGRHKELGLMKVSSEDLLTSPNYMPTFFVGKYPVTVREYRAFCAAARYIPNDIFFHETNDRDDHPIVFVNWLDAAEFAKWFGGTLPSESEWERAAGGAERRIYPWGDWRHNLANTAEHWERGNDIEAFRRERRVIASTTPVGNFSPDGDSPFGCSDMAGNVWEWTRDPWEGVHEDHFSIYISGGQADPKLAYALRGGSHVYDYSYARCDSRHRQRASLRVGNIGFRITVSAQSPDLSRAS